MKKLDTLIILLSKIYYLLLSFDFGKASCTLPENNHSGSKARNLQVYTLFPNHNIHMEWLQEVNYSNELDLIDMEEAMSIMNVSRSTLTRLRKSGKITTIYHHRAVRFLKSDIEHARGWYSIPKGKV